MGPASRLLPPTAPVEGLIGSPGVGTRARPSSRWGRTW